MGDSVTVRKLKFDGSVRYEWDGELLEERDDWLIVLHDSSRHVKRENVEAPPKGDGGLGLHYGGIGGPLTILFWFDETGNFVEAKCDAALPALRSGGNIDFVDLDLDVVVLPGGVHYVRDQDVFAERIVSMGYSEEAKRAAHLGILHALRIVRRRQFPFDGHAERLVSDILSGAAPRR